MVESRSMAPAARARIRAAGNRSQLMLSLCSAPRRLRDAVGRHLPGALMRRWLCGNYADHIDRSRREESLARDFRLRSASPRSTGVGRQVPLLRGSCQDASCGIVAASNRWQVGSKLARAPRAPEPPSPRAPEPRAPSPEPRTLNLNPLQRIRDRLRRRRIRGHS